MFPPREIFFGDGSAPQEGKPADDDAPRFATAKAKWDEAYRKKWKIRNGPAGPLPQGMERKLGELARKVCRVLHVRGLGRIDVRLTPQGEVVVIEANPNPSLAKEDDFAQAAGQVGIGYEALVQKILDAATHVDRALFRAEHMRGRTASARRSATAEMRPGGPTRRARVRWRRAR